MEEPFRTLLRAATQAPSGDNTQPWRFVLDPDARRIALHVDETRDPSPMNTGQRMSRIAVGAALENLLRTARSKGWTAELEQPCDGALAMVRMSHCDGNEGEVDPAIAARVTNRRRYDGRPVPTEVIAQLQGQTPELNGIRTHWIQDRHRLSLLASLIGRADAVMFGEASMRRAFLSNIRYDQSWDAEVEEGLPVASLELSPVERIGLRMMTQIPDWLLKLAGLRRKFAAAARRLVESASGLCVVVQKEITPEMDVLAGRAMERAWLALTAQDLAVQPMMSLAILENVLHHGTSDLSASLGRERTVALVEEFRAVVPEIAEGHTAFIMRFGFAPPPTARTGRLTPAAATTEMPLPGSQRSAAILS